MMRNAIGGAITVHIVQHEYYGADINPHETSRLPLSKQQLVRRWTEAGKYADAIITRHSEQLRNYPSLPSRRRAAEFASSHDYAFHLWLEDDAFVYDVDCASWEALIGPNQVGVYKRNPYGYINAAHYVARPAFDRKLLPLLRKDANWDITASMFRWDGAVKRLNELAPRIEPALTRLADGRISGLCAEAAGRYNVNKPESYVGLKALLKRVCPAELHLLGLDFPE